MVDASKLVMVADSDPYVRELMSRFIQDAGFDVTIAVDGYEALDDARKLLPFAIFIDLMLPRLDGLALCRLLKGDPETSSIAKVVVLSVLHQEEKAKKSGADHFILKPLEKSKILKVLDEASKVRGND